MDWRALKDPELARGWLAPRLLRGRVTLVIGAGVSMAAGLPGWKALLEGTARAANMTDVEVAEIVGMASYYDAVEAIRKHLKSDELLNAAVRAGLYKGVGYGMHTLRAATLIAIGSWLRRDLGGVRTVISLNFDDLIEWYCETMGISARGSGMPTSPVGVDVTILHPHGYLPRPPERDQGRVVFSRPFAEAHLGVAGREWTTVIERTMAQTVCVFYGMSSDTANDWTFSPLLRSAHEIKMGGLVGFWLFGSPISAGLKERLDGMGIVPLSFDGHEASALFLLSVASGAYLRTQT